MLIAGIAMMAGCTNKRNPYESDERLAFNPVVNMLTKADTTTAYPDGSVFGLIGYTLPSGSSWENNSAKATQIYDHAPVSNAGEYWQPSDPSLVKPLQRLSMIAYSPYEVDANVSCDMTNGLQIKGFDINNNSSDIMFADPVYDYNLSESKGIIQLPFTKVLTEISFFAFSDLSSGMSLRLKKLTLSGFRTKGDFVQLPDAEWTLSGDATELVVYDAGSSDGLEISDTPERTGQIGITTMMIPQVFNSVLVAEYQYVNSAGIAYNDKTDTLKYITHWTIGRKCVYVLKFDEQNDVIYSELSENL